MTLIAIVGEDNNHFRVVTTLVDDTVVASIDWVRDNLDYCRTWRGLHGDEEWYKYDPDDADDLRPVRIDGMTIKLQGRIAGEPLKSDARMWRRVLLLFCHCDPRPDIVVLVRDLDGYHARRAGLEQVRTGLSWPFAIVAATPEPEIEGWIVSGFVPRDEREQRSLEQLRHELSFDPTLHSHRLTSHPNDAPTDAKRVLSRLCNNDPDREHACLAREGPASARCRQLGASIPRRHRNHRAELGVVALDPRDRAVDQLARRHLAGADQLGGRGGVELGHRIRHLRGGRA